MLNIVVIMGRLTADPELKTTNSGNSVTSFTVAVDRNFAKDGNRETDFINVVAWRSTAEFICKYFRKGQMIAINGSLQQRSYEDRDGNKRTAYEVVAQQVSFCGGKQDKPSDAGHGTLAGATDVDFVDVDDGDLPFLGGIDMTQRERVLRHLKHYGSITQLEAMREYGIMRLGARIYDLRRDGYVIIKTTETTRNRYGEACSYARYRLEETA